MPVARLGPPREIEVNVFYLRDPCTNMYGEVVFDQPVRLGTLAAALVLAVVIIYLRFCGDLSLPDKPPPPTGPSGTQRELLTQSTASQPIYKEFLATDAATAGVHAPTIEEMTKKLSYRVDEARHVLEPGQPPIDVAGLRLHLERTSDQVVLVIDNLLDSDIAYEVTTAPSTGAQSCKSARPLPMNAMVIAKGGTERRTECAWREGMTIVVTKAETVEVQPLSAWYLSQVPPTAVGIEDRIARGHRGAKTQELCSSVLSQVVRTGIDRGNIGWRDLVDFYSRHRCQSYQFPPSYRAFKSDGERAVPAVDG